MRQFTQEEKAEIATQYTQGGTITGLMHAHGCRYAPIVAVLDETGVKIRGKFTPEEKERIAHKYRLGMTVKQLVVEYGSHHRTIGKILDEANSERRPQGYNSKLPEGRATLSELARKRVGEKCNSWKGGVTVIDGKRYVLRPNHPQATKAGYVAEHRLVMEKILGRFLLPEEIVHHINGNPLDNRPENLRLFPSNGAHRRHHLKKGDQRRNEAGQFEAKRI